MSLCRYIQLACSGGCFYLLEGAADFSPVNPLQISHKDRAHATLLAMHRLRLINQVKGMTEQVLGAAAGRLLPAMLMATPQLMSASRRTRKPSSFPGSNHLSVSHDESSAHEG